MHCLRLVQWQMRKVWPVYFCAGKWQGTEVVAIRMQKPESITAEKFLAEADVKKRLKHQNIVSLRAVVSREPVYVLTEYMPHGNLLNYFLSEAGQNAVLVERIHMAVQVAAGMAYLERMNYIHRDLRALNIFVGTNQVCKIEVFGIAKLNEIHQINNKEDAHLIRWQAPEAAANGEFTIKSDVWSFGILLTEIITKGEMPYKGGSDSGALILDESSSPAQELTIFQNFRLTFDFFPCKFAACSKPPCGDNDRKSVGLKDATT